MLLMVLVLPLRDGAARVASHADGRELGRDRRAGPTARAARNPLWLVRVEAFCLGRQAACKY